MDLTDAIATVARPGMLRPLIPCLVYRLGGDFVGTARFDVSLRLAPSRPESPRVLELTWDRERLRSIYGDLEEDLELLRDRRSALLEKATEFAGLALAICAVHEFLPTRRVLAFNVGQAPDLFLSLDRDAGIEVAARRSGAKAYQQAIRKKSERLAHRADLIEAHLSVWGLDVEKGCHTRIR